MKKIFSAVLCLLLIISLFACDTGGDESSAPSGSGSSLPSDTSGTGEPVNLKTLLETVSADFSLDDGGIYSSYSDQLGEYMDDEMISGKYGAAGISPDFGVYSQYAIFFSYDTYGDEVALFEMKDGESSENTQSFLRARMDELVRNAVNYPTVDANKFENAVIGTSGNYVYCIACDDADGVRTAIENALK